MTADAGRPACLNTAVPDGPITVEIVDDHFLFAQALGGIVGEQPGFEVVGIAVTGPQALGIARERQPAVVLLDYHLPGMTADALLPRILAAAPGAKVIVLTSDASVAARENSGRSGAHGFLTKDTAIDDVVDSIMRVVGAPAPVGAPEALAAPSGAPSAAAPAPAERSAESTAVRVLDAGSFAGAAAFARHLEREPGITAVWLRRIENGTASVYVGAARPDELAQAIARAAAQLRVTIA